MKTLKFLVLIGLMIGNASFADDKTIICYFNKDGEKCTDGCFHEIAKEADCAVVTGYLMILECKKKPDSNTSCGKCIDYCEFPK